MNHISELFTFAKMSREEAIKHIEENPEDVYDLLIFVSKWINDGWMKRYRRNVK